jgi:hypothetical protein
MPNMYLKSIGTKVYSKCNHITCYQHVVYKWRKCCQPFSSNGQILWVVVVAFWLYDNYYLNSSSRSWLWFCSRYLWPARGIWAPWIGLEHDELFWSVINIKGGKQGPWALNKASQNHVSWKTTWNHTSLWDIWHSSWICIPLEYFSHNRWVKGP